MRSLPSYARAPSESRSATARPFPRTWPIPLAHAPGRPGFAGDRWRGVRLFAARSPETTCSAKQGCARAPALTSDRAPPPPAHRRGRTAKLRVLEIADPLSRPKLQQVRARSMVGKLDWHFQKERLTSELTANLDVAATGSRITAHQQPRVAVDQRRRRFRRKL